MNENSGTHEIVPEPADTTFICAECNERLPMDIMLVHLAVCQGIDVTNAHEWPIVDIEDPDA